VIARYSTPDMDELWSETGKYSRWLEVELAVSAAWENLGEIPTGTTQTLRKRLPNTLDDTFVARIEVLERETRHDVVAFTRALTERAGDVGRYIHLGLTSTDIVDTAQNLALVRAVELIVQDVHKLMTAVKQLAITHKYTSCIGRSHGIHGEPMSFGLKFLNFYSALDRDVMRLERARDTIGIAMASGSVGTYAHIPPAVEAHVATLLNLTADPISNQTVARDRHAEVLSTLAILGTSLERIALEIRHLQRSEVREAQEGFRKGQTGSSSMPHKKNPIASENISGLVRILRSNLQAGLENVALWHERDISHSSVERVILPDSTTLASYLTRRLTRVLNQLEVYPDAMQTHLDQFHGLIHSQRVLHLLIDQGLSREDAYEIVQRASLICWDTGQPLQDVLEADTANPLKGEALASAFETSWYLRFVDDIYARFEL
jgi:adenylosuccinate lyase